MSINREIKKMWYIYTIEYYTDIKKNEITSSAWTWRLSYWVKSDREAETMYDIPHTEPKKSWHKSTYLQNRNRLRDWERKLTLPRVRRGERERQGVWGGHVHTAVLRMDNQQGPTTAQGTLLSVMRQAGGEGSLGESGYMYMYGWVPLLSTWNFHNIVNWLYSSTNKKCNKEKVNAWKLHRLHVLSKVRQHNWIAGDLTSSS